MFYLYNKFTSASTRSHEEKKDNIVDAGRDATLPASENVTRGRSSERDNKAEEDDLFCALEENERSREVIMENERHENGVEEGSDIFLIGEKMSARCSASEFSRQGGDTWWDGNPTWGAMAPLEGQVGTHLDQPSEHHQNGSKTDQPNENAQHGGPLCEEFDEDGDEFFKIDQDNFSSFTFAVSCATEWKGEKEHLQNSNDEAQIKDSTNEQHKEYPFENGYLFDNSSDHVKINLSLHPRAQMESGNFDQTVMNGCSPRGEMASFVEFISHGNLTRYFNKGEECEEENEGGIQFEANVSTHIQERERNLEGIFKEESVLHTLLEGEPIASEGEEECPLGIIEDIDVSYEKESRGETRNTMSRIRGVGQDRVEKGAEVNNPNEAEKDTTNELHMFDPIMPDDEESECNFFQGVHFPQKWQAAPREGPRSGDYSHADNGKSNFCPVDIHICPKSSENKFKLNFCSYEFPGPANINGQEEEDRDACFDNKKLEKISEELETQNWNRPIENPSRVDSERGAVQPKVVGENGKEVRSKNLCDEKQACEVGQSGITEKWDEKKLMQINTFQRTNFEMDNVKKSSDVFLCRDDEQYEVASISENHGEESFFFENKEKIETVNLEKSDERKAVSVGEEVLLVEVAVQGGEDDFSLFQSEQSVRVVEVENEESASLLENKQTVEVVNMLDMMNLLDVVEDDGGASAKERNFFDRKETYETEEAAEESKRKTLHDVFSFETVDLKSGNSNESAKISTYIGLDEFSGKNEVGGNLYETGEDTERVAVQREEEEGGKGEQVNIEEMNESKGDSHFSDKEMEEIKTVELVGQTKKKFYPHKEEEDSGNDHELDEDSKCLEDNPDDDAEDILGENLIKEGEELNSILLPKITNEQFVQEQDNGTENKLESLLCVPSNMMQKNFLFDQHKRDMLPTTGRDTNPVRANDIEEKNRWEEDKQTECVETVKEPEICMQIWNEFYEKEAAQKVHCHGKMIKENGTDAMTGLTDEEIFEAANLNDKKEKKKKKKKIKKSRIISEKPFEYDSGSLKYLKAVKELPPLDFLKCKDLRPFLRLFNIVLKAVRMFRSSEDYLYVLAGDETGCIYVKLEMKHEKFCQEDQTFMLANCCVSVEAGHAFLEINEYSDIFSLKYNPIGTVNKSVNFSDSKFLAL
ncbi:hypothetical protein C922_02871 [Plasmodium inui San Antonio 1]|uniref:Uncharacterized protein n=1 Tax=Plasmodium inui San Antonio 1 TaxID=1237626 RepID=W7A565_9APIC|nr:hypothetical protein C922_02871 [Plasmodium inui San Antonio 1]EUD66885.1 hypothetical protein C922_02871 [Plasmodium inui San Antonio 1]